MMNFVQTRTVMSSLKIVSNLLFFLTIYLLIFELKALPDRGIFGKKKSPSSFKIDYKNSRYILID